MRGRPRRDLAERFWSKVDRRGRGECWPWKGGRDRQNYGKFWVAGAPGEPGRTVHASQMALELSLGRPLKAGMGACHHCDNPPCCNPADLYEGSPQENTADRHERGRDPRGERHGKAKLSESVVRELRAAYVARDRRLGPTALSRRFGIPVGTVRNVVYGIAWRHVQPIGIEEGLTRRPGA